MMYNTSLILEEKFNEASHRITGAIAWNLHFS